MFGIRAGTALLGVATLLVGCGQATDEDTGRQPTTSTTSTMPTGTTETFPAEAHGAAMATPVLASVVAAPIPVPATDGNGHLAYELQLTNAMSHEVTLTSLAVLAGDQTLLRLAGDELGYWTRILGSATPTTTLGPGQSAVVWLDVTLDRPADGSSPAIPTSLSHEISVRLSQPRPPLLPETVTETVAPVTVSNRRPPVIAPPLRGPNWLGGNSCCDMTSHRMAMNPLNGQLWGAERYAIDYVQLGPDRRIFTGDKAELESYPYFGTDVVAVADGPVVAVVDGLPEQVPGTSPTDLPLEEYGGNHVVQDIGDGNYAFYAHLKTDSIAVRRGDELRTGQTIGALGNSGNTDAPHLHFHVMSSADPLRSDGLPFVFSAFRVDSRLESLQALDPLLDGQPARLRPGFEARDYTDVSPLVLDVMTYDNP